MDELLALVEDHATEDSWTLINNGMVIVVKCTVEPPALSVQDAVEAATTLVGSFVAQGYTVVNRADIGAHHDGLLWRGSLDVCLRPSNGVGEHQPISVA